MWSENLFDASHATERHTAKKLVTANLRTLLFQIFRQMVFVELLKYAYAENTTSAFSQIGKNTPILNGTNEKVNSLKIVVMPSFIPSKKMVFPTLHNGLARLVFNLLHRLGQPQTETSQTGRNGKFQDGMVSE